MTGLASKLLCIQSRFNGGSNLVVLTVTIVVATIDIYQLSTTTLLSRFLPPLQQLNLRAPLSWPRLKPLVSFERTTEAHAPRDTSLLVHSLKTLQNNHQKK